MRRKGFTLVELITVIAIIGVLIIIAVPIYNNMAGNTQEKAYENKVKLVEIAAANYAENFKNELKVSTEKVCVSINTLIKEEFLTSDGKNELYLTNPNLNGIETTEHLMGSVELRYENDEIVAKYDLEGNCGIHVEKQNIDGNKYEIDITPPTGSMRIIEGDFTNNTRIHLELTLPDADAAYFCYSYTNTEGCLIYKNIKDYNIKRIEYNLANNNDGVHHVFLWLKDKYGNVSNPLSDSILYDKVKPTGTITINNGNRYTNNPSVNLKFTYTDQQPASGVYEMCVSNSAACPENGWESDKETRSWTLESIEGDRTVTVWFKDRAGNISNPYTAVIMLDTTAPTCTNSGDSTSWTSGSRTIYRGCSDGQSGCSTDTASTTYSSTTRTATIAAYTIYDKAGNETSCPSRTANVYVDNTAPSCSIAFTACSASGTGTCTDSNSGVKTGASASITANTTMSHSCEDNVGNTSSCSITKTYDDCCTGSVVCVPGYKTCTNTACCGTYCNSYGHIYECYQLTGGYGCGTKCASSTPTSSGQIWYKTTEKCCLSSEPATCTKACCGTDPCLTTTNSCIAGYK